jgi:hypothetical protein
MKKTFILIAIGLIMSTLSNAQNESPADAEKKDQYYYQIPDYPGEFTAETVAARLVDGLGFRFYWATEGLRQEDLDYKPSESSRTTGETMEHIFGLSRTIINATQGKPNTRFEEELTSAQMRQRTLENIENASKILRQANKGDINDMKVIFQRGENTTEYPFWNMINGPIADAIYHTGQVVGYRRASGNPIPGGVRMLTGQKTEP